MASIEEKYNEIGEIVQEWVDQQGHDRCWYYPDLFRRIAKIYGIEPKMEPNLPPLEEFKEGCRRYQKEEYGYD